MDISIVALIGEAAETPEELRRQTNRYARLDLDDGTTSDRIEMVRDQQGTWMKIAGQAYQDNVLLTESALARYICGARAMFGAGKTFQGRPFPLAIRFTMPSPVTGTNMTACSAYRLRSAAI